MSRLNEIVCKGNLEFLEGLEDESVDLVVTSPPYDDIRDYHGYTMEIGKIISELYRVLKEGGTVSWVVGDRIKNGDKSLTSFKQAIAFQEQGFKVYEHLIYEKVGGSPPVKNRYMNTFEHIFIFTKGKPKTVNLIEDKPNKWAGKTGFGKHGIRGKDGVITEKKKNIIKEFGRRTTIWRYVNTYGFSTKDVEAHQHPAIFPEKLCEDLIKSYSNEGDLVIDIFLGSGTTAKMSYLTNRDFRGCDISEEYVKLAKSRVGKYYKKEEIEDKPKELQ